MKKKIGAKLYIYYLMSDSRQNIDQVNIQVQRKALILGVVLFGLKLTAYLITNSNAILTDALEGLVNILGAGLGLFSLYYATLPRDDNHPYGHGKIEFISSGFEGALIGIAGAGMIFKAIYAFFYPEEVHINTLSLGLIIFAGIVNYAMGYSMVQQGKKVNSVQLEAGGKHLISDGYTTAGLIIGLGVVWMTGIDALDNVLAIILGVIISVTGYKIIRKSIAGVMDEADQEYLEKMAEVLESQRRDAWVDIHNVRMVRYGAKIHLDAHLTLPWYYLLKDSHDEVNHLDSVLEGVFDGSIETSVHMEPCRKDLCGRCALSNCTERKEDFRDREVWTVQHLLNYKHEEI
ncbi:cation transporter [bacterium SCSIO 12643]|nr:cation transporter [bacterium SCSIO 12643]